MKTEKSVLFGSCMKKCTGTIDNKTQKNKELNRRYFIVILPKRNDIFFKRPKKKTDKRKSRKVISRNTTNQKTQKPMF